jgi:hypothetical protein
MTNKRTYDPAADVALARQAARGASINTTAPCTSGYWDQLANSKTKYITPPGGTQSGFGTHFTSDWAYFWFLSPNVITRFCVEDGHSYTVWSGMNPYNADKIGLTDTWHVDGISTSAGIGSGGPSGGISMSSNSITWSPGDDINKWRQDHWYSDVDFYGAALYGCSESHSGEAKFGTTWFYVGTSDSCR